MEAMLYRYSHGILAAVNNANPCNDQDPEHPGGPCNVQLTPDMNAGAKAFSQLSPLNNAFGFFALVIAIIVLFVTAIMWQVSLRSGNQEQIFNSRKGLIAACAAAFFIGALPYFINFWVRVGTSASS